VWHVMFAEQIPLGSQAVDAALLILPLLGIDQPGSPRVCGTIQAIRGGLGAAAPCTAACAVPTACPASRAPSCRARSG
jgi:hypothetical protein